MAGVFILFALASSFLLPRRNPDFPGSRLRLFVVATSVLFVAMLGTIVLLAREDEEEGGEHGAVATETQAETGPGETEPGPTETEPGGDAAAGADVFASAGCGGCHTLAEAGASGAIGPNLDESKPSADLVVERVTNGSGAMPSFADRLSEEQIQDVVAYVVESTSG